MVVKPCQVPDNHHYGVGDGEDDNGGGDGDDDSGDADAVADDIGDGRWWIYFLAMASLILLSPTGAVSFRT